MIGIGVIGFGYWGPKLARNLAEAGASIVAVSDPRHDCLAVAKAHYPRVDPIHRWQDLARHPKVDAVVVATPPSTHFDIAWESLSLGKHVLIEKPMTTSSEHARRLTDAAATGGLTLMVDQTFLYASSVQCIRDMIVEGSLGELQYYDSVRIGPRPPCIDVDVMWDLAAHDIAIMDHIFDRRPEAIAAIGLGHPAGSPVDDAHVTFTFGGDLISHLHVGWLSPVKIRRMLLGGSTRMISFDDTDSSEKIKVYDSPTAVLCKQQKAARFQHGAKAGGVWAPQLDAEETLATVAREFLGCIAENRRPLADGEAGLRVVEVLEVAGASLRQGGRMLRFPDAMPI